MRLGLVDGARWLLNMVYRAIRGFRSQQRLLRMAVSPLSERRVRSPGPLSHWIVRERESYVAGFVQAF